MKNILNSSPKNLSVVGVIFFGTALISAIALGISAYFELGQFKDPESLNLALKFLVGFFVTGFFLTILLDDLYILLDEIKPSNKFDWDPSYL